MILYVLAFLVVAVALLACRPSRGARREPRLRSDFFDIPDQPGDDRGLTVGTKADRGTQ